MIPTAETLQRELLKHEQVIAYHPHGSGPRIACCCGWEAADASADRETWCAHVATAQAAALLNVLAGEASR